MKIFTSRTIVMIALSVAWSAPCLANGDFKSGNVLYEQCMNARLLASQYIVGVSDAETMTADVFGRKSLICYPDNVIVQQVTDIACNYLQQHPERRSYTAASNVVGALTIAFPCR